MDEDDDILDKLAKSIADGDSIQWDEIDKLPADDPRRRLLEHLRVVADIADVHRSAVDDSADDVPTGPAHGQPPLIGHIPPPATQEDHGQGLGRWGHLLLRTKIGTGGFGEVFHAHDMWLDHPVALKLLKPEVAKSDSTRILHEARRLARVRHPNVVAVHGADMHGGRIGFWMDLIEGDTLDKLVVRGRLSPGEAAHIGQEICLALAAVHGANLVHRDVKAQNVMRASDGGRIILMDFGAGEFMDRPPVDGRVRGTPLYLAPELFNEVGASIATDIYAAGVLLFHLVTGGFPVNGSSVDKLADAHKRGVRRRLRDVRPDLPDAFVDVVERAIDPIPKRRFASAGEMYTALGGEERGRPGTETQKLTATQKVLRVALSVAVVLAAMFVLGLFVSRAFESALRIDPAFSAGVTDYFLAGRRVLLPFVILWTASAAVVAALVGLRALLWSHLGPIRRALSKLTTRVDPTAQAGLIVCAGVVGLVVLGWSFYGVYYALTALALDPMPDALDLSILGPDGRDLRGNHAYGSAFVTFLLGLAAWSWFPRLEKRAAEPSHVRTLKWAAVVIAFLVILVEAGVRPFIWDIREVVLLKSQPAFVIGSSNDELLLFNPAKGERRSVRVRKDAPDLRRNVAQRALFDALPGDLNAN